MTVYKVYDKEYKEENDPRVTKDVVAFLNTNGGTIYIGGKDDGTVTGVDDMDDTILRVINDLKESILPDILPFVEVNKTDIEGKIFL